MATTTLNSATSAQPANGLMDMLPDDWFTNYDAAKKIDWYNTNNIGPDQLVGAGVGGADIQWMTKNGYTGGGAQDSLYNKLPDNWFTDYDAAEKIDWYNSNGIDNGALTQAGVGADDINYMRNNGFTGRPETQAGGSDLIAALRGQTPQGPANPGVKFFQNRTIPTGTGMVRGARQQTGNLNTPKVDLASGSQNVVQPPKTTRPTATTQPAVTAKPPAPNDSPLYDQLPDDWYSDYDAAEKINWYNENNVTTKDLMEANVHAADIQWMIDNGYTAGNAQESLIAQLPDDWRSYNAADKIDWYNDNSITADALLNEGVPLSDIEWMLANGYTGGRSQNEYANGGTGA